MIRASELAILDAGEPDLPADIDTTAWAIHGTLHRLLPRARCVMHVHPTYATALSALQDPRLLPVDQTSARFFNRVAVDEVYGGFADNSTEGERLATAMGDKKILLMRNHGLMVTGANVAAVFDLLYHFERAARTLLLAYGSGQPVRVLDDEIAEGPPAPGKPNQNLPMSILSRCARGLIRVIEAKTGCVSIASFCDQKSASCAKKGRCGERFRRLPASSPWAVKLLPAGINAKI